MYKFIIGKHIPKDFSLFSFAALLFFLIISCNKPKYSNTPSIELLSFQKSKGINSEDSLSFVFKIKDGDGNLGLNADDYPTVPSRQVFDALGNPIYYDENNPSSAFNCLEWETQFDADTRTFKYYKKETNIAYFNLFIDIEKKVGNDYVKLDNSCFSVGKHRFFRLAPEGYTGPLNVKLYYNLGVNFLSNSVDLATTLIGLKFNDVIRFKVYVVDRDLNKSNGIYTSDVVVN